MPEWKINICLDVKWEIVRENIYKENPYLGEVGQ
jgi:hypothetical protein